MSATAVETRPSFSALRTVLIIAGVLAVVAGAGVLLWPLKTAFIVTGILAAYLVIGGIVYVGLGIFAAKGTFWARLGHIVLGLLYIASAVIAFVNLPATTLLLALFTAVMIGASWIFDGVVSLTLLRSDRSQGWTIFYAIVSILAGAIVLFAPMLAAEALWWVLGVTLVALGLLQIIRAVTVGRGGAGAAAARTPATVVLPAAEPEPVADEDAGAAASVPAVVPDIAETAEVSVAEATEAPATDAVDETVTEESVPSADDEGAPAVSTLPADETTPGANTLPAGDTSPGANTLPADETTPAVNTLPADDTPPADESGAAPEDDAAQQEK